MRIAALTLVLVTMLALGWPTRCYGATDNEELALRLRAEAEEIAVAMRDLLVMGAEAGVRESVYIEFGGSVVRGTLVSATDTGLEVQTSMAAVSLPWERIGPQRLYLIGKPYVPEDDPYLR